MIKKILFKISAVLLSLIICLLLLEVILWMGVMDDTDNPKPIWIPHKFSKQNKMINKDNWNFAELNPYRFTDRIRSFEKREGLTRIAILGDSVIWGYGLPYSYVWSHRLEKMVNGKYPELEVMSWGRGGWSTTDQLSFLEKEGVKYDIDYLIVSWVDNDPDMKDIKSKRYRWHGAKGIKILKLIFPNAVSFIVSHVNNYLTNNYYTDHQYHNWLEMLYSEDNLKKYSEVLHDFSRYCNSNNIKLLFVLIPLRSDNMELDKFNRIIPLMEEAHIKYLNLFPFIKSEIDQINPRKLWANPANGHPGKLLTKLYAEYTFSYLEGNGILNNDIKPKKHLALKGDSKDLLDLALKNDDWELRKEAAIELSGLNAPYLTDMLIKAVNDNDSDIREAAVDALGEVSDPKAIPHLIAALKDDSAHVRMRAVLALASKKDDRIIEPLTETAINDSDKYVRRRAVLSISNIKDHRVTECLISCLNDSSYYIRKTAVIALGKTRGVPACSALIDLLKNDRKWDLRAAAAEALGEINDPCAVEALKTSSLKDSHPYVRDVSADSIKKITGDSYGRYRRKLLRIWQSF